MKFSEETLMAYADNELDAQTRTAVEEAMATDPEVAKRVAQHKALRGKLRLAFDNVINEPTPQRLIDAARGVPAVRREGNVIPLRRKAPPPRAWPQWASIAASLVVGVIIGQAMLRGSGSDLVTSRGGQLLANSVLAHAL
jgi:anti-sigma factor RsiW